MVNKNDYQQFKSLVNNTDDVKVLELYLNHYKKKRFYNSPLTPLILSAFFALTGTGFGAWLQGNSNLKLEQKKLESSLITKMLDKAATPEDAAKNLMFLADAGLIYDEETEDNIRKLAKDPTNIPSFGIVGDQLNALNDRKNYVLLAQRKLKDLGFYSGPLSGAESKQLGDAVKGFQSSIDLHADGLIDNLTLKSLEEAHKQREETSSAGNEE